VVLERNELVSPEQSGRCGMNGAGNYTDGPLIRLNTSLKVIQGLYGYIVIIRTAHFVRRYSKFVVSISDVALLRKCPSTFSDFHPATYYDLHGLLEGFIPTQTLQLYVLSLLQGAGHKLRTMKLKCVSHRVMVNN
jgi:hypothetical protein